MSYSIPTDPAEALKDVRAAIGLWTHRDERMDADRTAWQLPTPPLKEGEEPMRLNDNAVQVDGPTDLMTRTDMDISVAPWLADDPNATDVAQRTEDMLRWWIEEAALRHAQGIRNPLLKDINQSLNLEGWLAGRLLLNPGDSSYPFSFDLLNPRTIYPDSYDGEPDLIVHLYSTTLRGLEAKWGKRAAGKLDLTDRNRTLTCYGLYTKTQLAVLVNGQWLKKPVAHKYGFNPLIVVTATGSSWRGPLPEGSTATSGTDEEQWDRYVGTGVLQAIRPVVEDMQAIATMQRVLMAKGADPPTIGFIEDADADNPADVPVNAKETATWGPRDRVEMLAPPPAALQYSMGLRTLGQSQIQQAGMNAALLGGGAASAGYDRFLLSDAGARSLVPRMRALRVFWQLVLRGVVRLFALYGGDAITYLATDRLTGVRTAANRISPLEVVGADVAITVNFGDPGPQDKQVMGALAVQLVNAGIADLDYVLSDLLHVPNPTAVKHRARQDKIDQHPVMLLLDGLADAAARPDPARPYRQQVAEVLLQQELQKFSLASAASQAGPGPSAAQPPTANVSLPNAVLPDELGVNAGAGPNGEVMSAAAPGAPPQAF